MTESFSSRIIYRAFSYNIFFQVLPVLIGVLSVPLIINIFGKDLFSVYSISIVFLVGMNYVNLGIHNYLTRELSKYEIYKKINPVQYFGHLSL